MQISTKIATKHPQRKFKNVQKKSHALFQKEMMMTFNQLSFKIITLLVSLVLENVSQVSNGRLVPHLKFY